MPPLLSSSLLNSGRISDSEGFFSAQQPETNSRIQSSQQLTAEHTVISSQQQIAAKNNQQPTAEYTVISSNSRTNQ
jgi:hypothetical protein